MRNKILFRADGDQFIGLGHLYRLFAMAEMLKGECDFSFVTKKSSTVSVIPEKYGISLIPDDISLVQEPDWLSKNFSPANHVIIADGYQFDSGYQKLIKKQGYKLVYIDDLAKEHMYADIVVNHSPNIEVSSYVHNGNSKFALGPKYALLRPKFLEMAKQTREINCIKAAFICFGGADRHDLSFKATKALLQFSEIEHIHVVLGAAYKNEAVFKLQQDFPKIVELHKNVTEDRLIQIMRVCDMGIAPASTIIYELCCIKMLILGGYFVANQRKIYKGLVNMKVIFPGGDFEHFTISQFANKIELMVKDKIHSTYTNSQMRLFDGKSNLRLLGLINSLHLTMRKANANDLIRIYKWSNDTAVRKNSYQSKSIVLEEHTEWYKNKLKDKNTLFLIVYINDEPAGMVRYHLEDHHAVIGIMIDPKYRGQKLANVFLTATAKKYFCTFDKPVLAYIKTDNIGSIKSFENAGYQKVKETLIQKQRSFIYKLERKDAIR